ncbi:MAG: aminopeptidase [Lachnospiraceae bacterium]|nr:aminopeptidase [Lachnospiraceae bacterium]
MSRKSEYTHEYTHILKNDKRCMDDAFDFCEDYKDFMNASKTERECTNRIIEMAKENGYVEFDKSITSVSQGKKFFVNNRGKSVILITIGKEKIDKGVNFVISHIDSPRLDLKPNPVYECEDIAYFKTHYYGGIKKYQWPTVPLSMHGRIFREDGSFVDISLGENDDEPKFIITDLLPHLAKEQEKRTLGEGVTGEELNIVIGSIPIIDTDEEIKEAVKENTLKILYETFKIKEKDFARAEIEFVPASKATDIGFDKSMIAAYGQDDKVCAYPALIAEIENEKPVKTSVTVFTDKEEIGSEGNTGMKAEYLFEVMEDLADIQKVKVRDCYRNSICLSSDVNSAYDPTFADVFEKRNSSHINRGVVLTKYTGHAGKSGSNDASAETMAKVIKLMDDRNVVWQIGELGKVDIGGGGTIAKFVSRRNIDTIDVGVAVLSMHSPYELTSKLDIYHTYLAYKAFLLNNN